jgi:catechol 2,3-dioxygenase-like lactoylglutathione lyase family enzyme
MGFSRLDHVICRTPDIERAHASLQSMGFAKAWPIGPFWPGALTSGIAIGGLNLELYQSLDKPLERGFIDTLVFEPTSLEAVEAKIPVRRFEKIEPDPALLRLRGFAETETPQRICTNLFPLEPAPIDFFVCEYVPFLRDRLTPARFPMPHGEVVAITVPVPEPEAATTFLQHLGYAGIPLKFIQGAVPDDWQLEFADGFRLTL